MSSRMKDQVVKVCALFIDSEDLDDAEPIDVSSTENIAHNSVRFHPVSNESSTDGPSGLSISELIEEFEEEFNVNIESDFSDDYQELNIVDHSFESIDALEECVEALCLKIKDWIEGT